jgi:predicted RNase H-like nuclease
VVFVGVDLAWGSRAITGLAIVDRDGSLLEVAEAVSDEQVLDWLEPWTAGPCLVAFDAPLVVTNPTGSRECEKLIGRYFGRFGASCYPSNTANPAFADGGRAARLSRRLGLATAMDSTEPRRAIEVYPHPAMIVLFGLPRLLRYKDKPGRTQFDRRDQMRQLLDHIEALHDADVPLRVAGHAGWRAIRDTVERASRKVDLRRVEDRVDAVVCAYIALLTVTRPDAVRTLVGTDGGFIVTPVTPGIGALIDGSGGAHGRR